MSNEAMSLTSYDAAGRRVRALVIDGSPWLVGADILRALFGTAKSKGNAYLKLADDEHRRVHRGNLGLHAGRAMALVSESGFYKLVMRSDKPDALAFQEWVTREVLPAIRRTGGYRLQGVAPEAVEEGTVSEMPDVAGVMAQLRELRAEMAAVCMQPELAAPENRKVLTTSRSRLALSLAQVIER